MYCDQSTGESMVIFLSYALKWYYSVQSVTLKLVTCSVVQNILFKNTLFITQFTGKNVHAQSLLCTYKESAFLPVKKRETVRTSEPITARLQVTWCRSHRRRVSQMKPTHLNHYSLIGCQTVSRVLLLIIRAAGLMKMRPKFINLIKWNDELRVSFTQVSFVNICIS